MYLQIPSRVQSYKRKNEKQKMIIKFETLQKTRLRAKRKTITKERQKRNDNTFIISELQHIGNTCVLLRYRNLFTT